MPTDFKLPELGENIAAGDVVRVLVSPGDTVKKDQPLLELETDKATIEVPSSVSGTVREVKVKQGEKVKVGQVVLTVDDGGGAAASAPAAKPEPAQPAAKNDVQADRPKSPSTGAPEAGGLSQQTPEAGVAAATDKDKTATPASESKPKRGEVVDIRGAARSAPAPQLQAQAPSEPEPQGPAAPAAPSVRRLARELGVDIKRVPGSGPAGRISGDDVQAFVRSAMAGGSGAGAAVALPDFAKWGDVERKPMSNIRRKTAEHLSHAWTTIPHVTQHDKSDITALEALRKQYSPLAEKQGGKLTMTAIALKIVAGALQRYPQFNSSIDLARNEIIYKKSIHVGVAADTERGLLVPVIRDVDRKGVLQLAVELGAASEKARAGKLSLEEMQGGGFTITNLGGIGGTSFTPIVNWPEVAILGISRGVREPTYIGDRLEPRLMLPLSLSYDHRVIDGADAARFLRWVAEAFEQPFVMAL
jgi:pyruvate dehydrogenase E2 component (dihydrolipoyllysine-residue acetyltransferase)